MFLGIKLGAVCAGSAQCWRSAALKLGKHCASMSASSNGETNSSTKTNAIGTGLLLGGVPALWGSYAVASKILFDMDPGVPLSIVNLGCFFTAMLTIVGASIKRSKGKPEAEPESAPVSNPLSVLNADWANLRVGLELGFYLYLGNWLNLQSLERTSASRCAFLVQLTTVIVPLADGALGGNPSRKIYSASALALFGSVLLSLSDNVQASTTQLTPDHLTNALNIGDTLAVLSALVFSLHVIRLEQLSKRVKSAVNLVRDKTMIQLVFSIACMVWTFGSSDVQRFVAAVPTMSLRTLSEVSLLIVWLGSATSALATWAQVAGQKRVGPSRAAVVYASQPVWATSLAVASGIDHPTQNEIVGGFLIVLAAIWTVLPSPGSK